MNPASDSSQHSFIWTADFIGQIMAYLEHTFSSRGRFAFAMRSIGKLTLKFAIEVIALPNSNLIITKNTFHFQTILFYSGYLMYMITLLSKSKNNIIVVN